MVSILDALVRPALARDEQQIANLIHFEPYVHRHLDWRAPLEWLGSPYYWVLEHGRVAAALACPPDPQGIHWLRLFACASSFETQEAWEILWHTARENLPPGVQTAVIALHDWMRPLLQASGFIRAQDIVMLEWNDRRAPATPAALNGFSLRPMMVEDLPQVATLDALAFAPLWRNSLAGLEKAFSQAGHATVVEEAGRLIGYQITTQNPFSAHLARLAVHPGVQRRGVGYELVHDLILAMQKRNLNRITVNTQSDNAASLALYGRLGFYRTQESYPVYVFEL